MIKTRPKASHRQEPLSSEASMLADGSGVQVGTAVDMAGTKAVAVAVAVLPFPGAIVGLVGEGVSEGDVAAGTETLGDGCGVEGGMVVSVISAVALPAPTVTVGRGDEEAAIVAEAVGGGIGVSEGTPGD
jgi:hypothetical protein